MSEFDRENQEVFSMVHNNPRRSEILRDVGVIVPMQKARDFAAYEAASKNDGIGFIIGACAAIALVLAAVVLVM